MDTVGPAEHEAACTLGPARSEAGPNEAFTRPGVAHAWDRLHPWLARRSAWLDHDGDLRVIDGTLIRLQVNHLPSDRDPKPVWLWCPATECPAR